MNDKEKEQITILRREGLSYQHIANILGLPRSTVSSHCLRNDISPPETVMFYEEGKYFYKTCPNCHELFSVKKNHAKQFCSDKCRTEYWRKNRAKRKEMTENKELKTLKKKLDLLEKKSDELDDDLVVGRIRETET